MDRLVARGDWRFHDVLFTAVPKTNRRRTDYASSWKAKNKSYRRGSCRGNHTLDPALAKPSPIGSFFQSCVSSRADKTKSFGCHLRPLLSVYVDFPVIRISVSFANVSIGFRRPPSCVASRPHCLKSKPLVSAADTSGEAAQFMPPSSATP